MGEHEHDEQLGGPAPEDGAAAAPAFEEMASPGDTPPAEPPPAELSDDEPQERRAAPGHALLRAPIGVDCSFSFGGLEYAVDEQGVVEVPSSAREQLQQHGFAFLSQSPLTPTG